LLRDGKPHTLKELRLSIHSAAESCLRLERWGMITSFYEKKITANNKQRIKIIRMV
jgi:hypothetical protein